jgi:hypothetical protein
MGVLRGVLKRAKRWHLIRDEIKALPVHHEVGRVLDPEEKLKLQTTAATNPDWENAYLAMTLTFNTTMRDRLEIQSQFELHPFAPKSTRLRVLA